MDVDEQGEPTNAITSKRHWPLSGQPPSPRLILLVTLVFTLISNWQRAPGPASLWRDSRLAYAIALFGGAMVVSLSLYLILRFALVVMKPRVTKQWRGGPLVFRTVSLAESILTFHLFRAIPWMCIGVGLGSLLSLVGGWIGIVVSPAPSWMILQAAIGLAAGLGAWLAVQHVERSN